MSLSNPRSSNPSTRYLRWAGGAEGGGRVVYYDKTDETEHEMKLPWNFIVLDELNCIGGFSDSEKSGFWSNEVRDMSQETFTVRTRAGVKARGMYGDIKDEIKSKGARYAKSVYIAFKDETGELQIGNLKLMGAALTAWIEFQKKYDISKVAVIVESGKKAKKGSNIYYTPVLEAQNISTATLEDAKVLDRELQTFLEAYFNFSPVDRDPVQDDTEWDKAKPSPAAEAKAKNVEIEDVESEGDDDSEAEKPAEPEQGAIDLKSVEF